MQHIVAAFTLQLIAAGVDFFVLRIDGVAAGCIGLLCLPEYAEIKRMYTRPEYRGQGIAKAIITELEHWAKEEGYTMAILETGHLQKDAIGLYQKLGYEITENFGQYIGVENSVCMKKNI